jgi:hypothetical protein
LADSAVIAFDLRGHIGQVEVAIEPNREPAELGCGLLSDEIHADAAVGFPVCTATIRYERTGYAAAFGWIQLVRSTDDPSNGQAFELDPLALLRGVDTPYAFFGIKPALFDAPFRSSYADLDWQAHTFLCFSPDAVMTKTVCAVTGFSWGFRLRDGGFTFQGPAELPPVEWTGHVTTLSAMFPAWTFQPGFHSH